MQVLPNPYRVFHFVCDELPYSIAVDHSTDFAGAEQESYLTGQFYAMLEAVLPGRRAAGKVTGITFFDDIHPAPGAGSNPQAGALWRPGQPAQVSVHLRRAACH